MVPLSFIGAAFIPSADQGELLISLELAPSASIYQTNLITQQAEKIIMKQPEVTNFFSSIGFVSGSTAGTTNNSNLSEITITMVDKDKRSVSAEEFGLALQKKLSTSIPGAKLPHHQHQLQGEQTSHLSR